MAEGSASTKKRRRRRDKDEDGSEGPGQASVGDLVAALDDAESRPKGEPPPPDDDVGQDEAAEGEAPAAETDDDGREIPEGVELSDTLPMAPEDDLSEVEGDASERLVTVVESLLFAAERPLTVKDIRRILKDPSVRQIQLALKALIAQTADRGVLVSQVAGGFRLRTNPNNAKYVQRMLAGRPARLSRSQLEALAVIAYRQPITKAEIDHVRGVDCSAVLRVLLERDLCRIVGRKEEPGRPILYGTTVEFLEFFNLKSLRDMPDLHEFRELTDDSRATLRERYGEDAEEIEAEVLGQQTLGLDTDADAESNEGDGEDASEEDDEGEAETEAEAASETEAEAASETETETEIEAESETETGDDDEPARGSDE